jgi:hypothetical protein
VNEQSPGNNALQRFAGAVTDALGWMVETLGDPETANAVRADLGLPPAGSSPPDAGQLQQFRDQQEKVKGFVTATDVTEQIVGNAVSDLFELAETAAAIAGMGAGADSVWNGIWAVTKIWVIDAMRVRNPPAYALCKLAGLITEDAETLATLDPGRALELFQGPGEPDPADWATLLYWIFTTGVGTGLVVADMVSKGPIDALYGWDPEPGTAPAAAAVASRALTVRLMPTAGKELVLTVIPVPPDHGGPGCVLGVGGTTEVSQRLGDYVIALKIGGAFSAFLGDPRRQGAFQVLGGSPQLSLSVQSTASGGRPMLLLGDAKATRLELGSVEYGIGIEQRLGFSAHLRKAKLVVVLGQGDGFLGNLPAATVEVPFELGLLLDEHGARFDGGNGFAVDIPAAAATQVGPFTLHRVELALELEEKSEVQVRVAFGVQLGPFEASVDGIGVSADATALQKGELGDFLGFVPPRGIGLALDAGPVKGGGYLYLDADRGEYAGALELSFLNFSIKALAIITTKRPDGSDGWSLLLLVFGQFQFHIGFGIFWTGIGGLIGLHHRVDVDALSAGMASGALDDVLFPDDVVADAPRILGRYRQLFPVEPDCLVLGPMLELSYSQPPIVYIRIGFVVEVRHALGGDQPARLSKVVLLGQLLVQLPPKATGAPAIVKLLVDLVGYYDAEKEFLFVRARLRDSFVGIEGLFKLELAGDLLVAMQFGASPSFVLSAGGFHPAFTDLPAGVPRDLARLSTSMGIGPLKMRNEQYFAVTSNSVQGGFKVQLTADFSPVTAEGWFQFDALLYLEPKFRFVVSMGFGVAVRVWGRSLLAVTVHLQLEGPGEWRAKGYLTFEILLWEFDIAFDESWGSAAAVAARVVSALDVALAELSRSGGVLPGPPQGGSALVTLAETAQPLVHPLALVSLQQKAVPFGVAIDRIGTDRLTERTVTITVQSVTVGSTPATQTPVLDHFARGQFMELTERDKLEGHSFETFACGVSVGTTAYAVPSTGTPVSVEYERVVLEPAVFLNLHLGRAAKGGVQAIPWPTAVATVSLGAAGRSARARDDALTILAPRRATVQQVPLAVVHRRDLSEAAGLSGLAAFSDAVATQVARRLADALVVEEYEVV